MNKQQLLQDKLHTLYFYNHVRNSMRTIHDVLGDIEVYGDDGLIDIQATRQNRKEIYQLYRRGEELYNEGWRLHFGQRRMVGAACIDEEPKNAVAYDDFPAGHISTVPAIHRVWLLPPRQQQ